MKKRSVRILFTVGVLVAIIYLFSCSDNAPSQPGEVKLNCPEGNTRYNGECSTIENIAKEIDKDLAAIQSMPNRGARSFKTIQDTIGPFLEKYLNNQNDYMVVSLLDKAIAISTKELGENELRLLLDLWYYQKTLSTAYPELSEGMRDSAIHFIEKNPKLINKVASDKNQLGRLLIGSAFIQFIDPYSVDTKTGKINDPRFGPELIEMQKIVEKEGLFGK